MNCIILLMALIGQLIAPLQYPILFVRFFEVDNDHGYSMDHIFKRVSETIKSLPGENPWGLYYNAFLQSLKKAYNT